MSTSLNEQQKQAVQAPDGPVLVIAGAGSGKTRVLTERIVHLVSDRGVAPANILAFTFTNRAAREMKIRLETRMSGVTNKLWVGTFHATGVRILRRHGDHAGIDRHFTIYDANDSLSAVKGIVTKHALGGSILRSPRSVRDRISRWKNELITPEMAADEASGPIDRRIAAVYQEYDKELRRAHALDFDDLIARVVELFSVSEEVKETYSRRFKHILVDEFQDTNPIQMAMVEQLASTHGSLFAVGDDDQSIYSWRGARVEHILEFENLYQNTQVIRLEQNYRSTQTILDAANQVIANNQGRKGKNLWTSGDRGEKVTLTVSTDEEAEAHNVLRQVMLFVSQGFDLKEIAVLYRTNAQSRALEDVLKLGSTPYQIIGSVRFYERTEVRDVLAYCKLLANPADNVNLKRILNVPRRGLGKGTYEKLAGLAEDRNTSMMSVLRAGSFDLAKAQTIRCGEFVRTFERLQEIAETREAPRVIEAILGEVKYTEHLKENYPDSDSRTENVEELVAAADAYAESAEDPSLAAFLAEIALVADIDSFDEERGQLTLMTLHNAKGLEFDCIIITGLEEGLFPHVNSLDNDDSLEEERRLFYVGMTRARKRLVCSYANMRRRMGVIEGGRPSRFLFELPENCLEESVEVDALQSRSEGPLFAGSGYGGASFSDFPLVEKTARHREFEDYSQEEVRFAVGMRIQHDNFGKGIIRRVEGTGENLRVTVIFDGGGERKFLAQYAPLYPL